MSKYINWFIINIIIKLYDYFYHIPVDPNPHTPLYVSGKL